MVKQASQQAIDISYYLMSSIRHLYIVATPETETYIKAHLDLVPLLVRQYTRIRYVFPRERTDLRLLIDPETGERRLICYVWTQKNVDKAIAQLNRYDRAWRNEAVPVTLVFVEKETP
jgi:hypothetical protein